MDTKAYQIVSSNWQGNPEIVARCLRGGISTAYVDDRNIAYVSNTNSLEDVVEFVVPALQKRVDKDGVCCFKRDAKGEFAEANWASELRDVHYGNTSPLEKLVKTKGAKKTEAETVQQQLVALTKKLSVFLSKQEQVNNRVAAPLRKLAPTSSGFHLKSESCHIRTWVAATG
ncbi:hypothetical protein NA56DRAFT_699067 [Hyaloscypha hepaticicola]|uniref:Uncharacterized protein n=1 Tax=Hyaloscypha hepaticicola TaxID=2082293 RepID=A0A2J6QIA2_9HELO|nr:hypothetical protein NA56DRAFT_699067 [Hyaloscypha hepaticicola]